MSDEEYVRSRWKRAELDNHTQCCGDNASAQNVLKTHNSPHPGGTTMESTNFFAGTSRSVTLGSPTLLVGRAGTRRLRLSLKMPLTGESLIGMPDWLSEAYTDVAKKYPKLSPAIEQIPDVTLAFRNTEPSPELFIHPDAKIPNAELRAFEVTRVGDADEPEVELHMAVYAPFARDFWQWIGEMAGQEVFVHFPSTMAGKTEVVAQPTLPTAGGKDLIAERPELDPKFDAQFAAPSLEEAIGPQPGSPEFEEQTRKSLGAHAAKPRMVSVRPPKPKGNGKAHAAVN